MIQIRTERPEDRREAERVTREAFYNVHAPGCDEHYLLHVMRDSAAFVPELALCAWQEGKMVGCVYQTRAAVNADDGTRREVLCLGPIGVLPAFQRQGVGAAMLARSRELAGAMDFDAILLYGDPAYYGRQGFEPAERYRIRTPDGMYADPLQICVLRPHAFTGVRGCFVEDSVFELDEAEALRFDAGFPPKEKMSGLPSQKRFLETVAMRRPADN